MGSNKHKGPSNSISNKYKLEKAASLRSLMYNRKKCLRKTTMKKSSTNNLLLQTLASTTMQNHLFLANEKMSLNMI